MFNMALGRFGKLAVSVLILGLGALSSQAQLLTIDTSNPSAVVITGTGEKPSINFTGGSTTWGIRLDAFFIADTVSYTAPTAMSTLATTGAANPLDTAIVRPGAVGKRTLILNHGIDPQNFDTSSPAFAGTVSFDLSTLGTLPGNGASGTIYAFDGSTTAAIGTYVVEPPAAPEPSVVAILGGFAVLAMVVRRRK